jgi:phytoene dehydrogenase-like protein
MDKATVVGSGPNGLAAAVTLARAGLNVTVLEAADEVGGGTRSGEVTLPGLIHDHCSGIHPLAVDNAFSRSVDLAGHGLSWTWPEVQYSHPLEAGAGAAVYRDVNHTAGALGKDAAVWRSVFGPLSRSFADVTEDFLRPMIHVPDHPVKLARFSAVAGMPVSVTARLLRTPEGRALFGGVAAHAFRPFHTPASSAVGAALGTAAHTFGWPAAVGGSAAISDAMVGVLESHGGRVETGVRVRSLSDIPDPGIVMLDTSPRAAVDIVGDLMPRAVSRALSRFRHGPGAFAVHFAVEGGIPWSHLPSREAGTVHVGGSFDETALAEREVHRGTMPERPFVLVTQQSVADHTRARDGIQPVDTYAHVPAGFTGDATAAIIDRIEEYAPGFRDRIVARTVWNVRHIEDANPNYIEGDIVTGANSVRQLLFRPRIALDPYSTGTRGIYLCSAATPPGAGAHGMCGYNAALSALKEHGADLPAGMGAAE